jgi:hypothetical protein
MVMVDPWGALLEGLLETPGEEDEAAAGRGGRAGAG